MSDLQVIPREMRVGNKTAVVESDTTLVSVKSLDKLAEVVRHEHKLVVDAGERMLAHAILCGDALREAKSRVKRGEWKRWVKENLPFSHGSAVFYMRASFYVDQLRENGIESVNGAKQFLADHQLMMAFDGPGSSLPDEQVAQIHALSKNGLTQQQIAGMVGCSDTTVGKYLADPLRGKHKPRRERYRRRPGRKANRHPFAITDDLVEGMAAWLCESFASHGYPSEVTDTVRDDATRALRAALSYDGPIPETAA